MKLPETTFTLLDAVYRAGIRRGEDEATAFEWGSRASGGQYDNLVEALYDFVNHGVEFGHADYKDWDAIEAWVKASRA